MRTLVFASVVTAALCASIASPAAQQKFEFVGPNQCLSCHDHDAERTWYEKKEIPEVQKLFPDRGNKAGHINSLQQLDDPKSDAFAKAINLADKYDAKGACVQCHATVFQGDANAGVSCESCHGPASGYLKQHSVKGSYEQAVAQYGMTRLVGNMQGWIQQCTNCHVMDDDRLIKAGHPSGDDFDLSKKYLPVSLHFKKTYNAAEIDSFAKGAMESMLRRRRPNSAPPPLPPVATVVPEPTPTAVATPTATPTTTLATPTAAPTVRPTPRPRPPLVAAGSPTSIEPPPPPPDVTPAPTTAASTSPAAVTTPTAIPADTTSSMMQQPLLWVAGVLVLALAIFFGLRKKK